MKNSQEITLIFTQFCVIFVSGYDPNTTTYLSVVSHSQECQAINTEVPF
ncbi:MAG: hypothetical protein ACJAZV_002137 [Roseivirga sp.]|jgi:hypothetical protein